MAGKRNTSSFTPEQLQAFGLQGANKDPQLPAGPPPLFPPLFVKPARLKSNADMDYKVQWKDVFHSYLRESPYYLGDPINPRKQSTAKPNFIYELFPAVLQPSSVKKSSSAGGAAAATEKSSEEATTPQAPPRKRQRIMDVDEKLKILEQKEEKIKIKQEVRVKNEPQSDVEEEDEDDDEFEPEDMEMDEDNDYDNNYFDNGEDFNDEDDNLDDGPVY